jgi:hypothetical protein
MWIGLWSLSGCEEVKMNFESFLKIIVEQSSER